MSDTLEILAAFAHDEQWSGWMRYLFSKCVHNDADGTATIPAWAVQRWTRQIDTPYADLPEDEKESDREEARRILALLAKEQAPQPSPAKRLHPMYEALEIIFNQFADLDGGQYRLHGGDLSIMLTTMAMAAVMGPAEAQGQALPLGMAQTGELFPRAIQWQLAVHAATEPGTCYRTACGELLETWAVMKAGVMSVNCPACLRALGAAPTPPGVTVSAVDLRTLAPWLRDSAWREATVLTDISTSEERAAVAALERLATLAAALKGETSHGTDTQG